jgi:hypothetical protein
LGGEVTLSLRGRKDFTGLAVDEVESEVCGPASELVEEAITLLGVVASGAGITIDEVALQRG